MTALARNVLVELFLGFLRLRERLVEIPQYFVRFSGKNSHNAPATNILRQNVRQPFLLILGLIALVCP